MTELPFHYQKGELYCESMPVDSIAEDVGTPFYLYSYGHLVERVKTLKQAFSEVNFQIHFAVKANSNISILRILALEGCGMDVVSAGEIFRCIRAGADPSSIVFAGVGKQEWEMRYALELGIGCFNIESEAELELLGAVAKDIGKRAPIAVRVNPDVDPKTHPYISTGLKKSKFGLTPEKAKVLYKRAMEMDSIEIVGIHCHIGSQITTVSPFRDAVERVIALVVELRKEGITIRDLDMGGGLGIRYKDETPPTPFELAEAVVPMVKEIGLNLHMEPGRWISGNCGALITKVLFEKRGETKNFLVVDAAMNDLARPSLYGAYHSIMASPLREGDGDVWDVVGPICESGDFLAQERELPPVKPGDLLAVCSAGAYGFSMSSNYNSRCRVPEVLVKGEGYWLIREREEFEDLVRGERIPPFLLEEED